MGNDWDRVVDVVVVGSGGAALVAATLAHDQGAEVLVVGTPGHTVGLVSEAGVLTLAGTTHPVPSSLQRMVEATVDLEVPADDTADLTRMLTPLARVVPVVSSDESVPVPDPVPPVLGLTVTWHSSTDAELGWSWRYGEDRCPLGSRERMGGLRDRAAEQVPGQRLGPRGHRPADMAERHRGRLVRAQQRKDKGQHQTNRWYVKSQQ